MSILRLRENCFVASPLTTTFHQIASEPKAAPGRFYHGTLLPLPLILEPTVTQAVCLNCNVSEQERPLITLKFQEKELHICPQCLPNLIHKPQSLASKIPGFTPPVVSPHEH